MSDLPSIADLLPRRPSSPPTSPSTDPLSSAQKDASPAAKTRAPASSSDTVSAAFEEKMHDIRLQEGEKENARQAAALGMAAMDLREFPISPEALGLIPKEDAARLQAVCFLYTGSEIRLGAVEPHEQQVADTLHALTERTHAHGSLFKISPESFRVALHAYERLPVTRPIVKGVKITDQELEEFQGAMKSWGDIDRTIQQATVSDLVTIVLSAALKFDSSDIHIEAEQETIAIRYRLDGVLQDVASLPHDNWKRIISRIKLISGLKINITDRPQDGRFTIFLKNADVEIRVSTVPTAWGESVVMRVLKPESIRVEFDALGLRSSQEKRLTAEMKKPHGMILTTGPTGSGKTTTLYAILRKLNTSEVKIVTLEDPIEYKLEGINQSQIDHAKNYTFATGLRSVLRQDPDIVMVGEIRDFETADVAVNAALTGHLMLSTVHTNSAAGAMPRLLSMGIKSFLLAPALNVVIGQRLVRRVHEACKEAFLPDVEMLSRMREALSTLPALSGETAPDLSAITFFHGKGCETCNFSGFKGRVGVYEILVVNEEVRQAMHEGLSEDEVKRLGAAQGMMNIVQDGFLKATEGITTPEEVVRVCGG